jgi:ABC-type Mn2+/Zn2+ transport system permease subunit/Mn-dependent DtxR family transcriptional regulator
MPSLPILTFFLLLLFCAPAHAALVSDSGYAQQADWWTQTLRFFSFRDPSVVAVLGGSLLLGLSCGLLGSFIVVRKMALVGDTLSHAVLPGVALGFLWTSTKNPLVILIGATLAGLLGTVVVDALRRTTKLKEDAALGLVLSSFYAVGICLVSMIQKLPTGNKSGISTYMFGQAAAISGDDVILMAVTTGLTVVILSLFYKEFLLLSFDGGFASSIGLPVRFLHQLLMVLTALAIVVAMQAVGVVLVSALLIIPAASAYLLTDRLHRLVGMAAVFGMVSAALGAYLSFLQARLPTGPLMVLAACAVFGAAFFFAPRHGVVAKAWRRFDRRRKIARENTLKAVYQVLEDREFQGESVSLRELAQKRRETLEDTRKEARDLLHGGLATLGKDGDELYLTPSGWQQACMMVRNHRLWELYLTHAANYNPDHVHEDAERIEHALGEETVRQLERRLSFPNRDPHGKPIPSVRDLINAHAIPSGEPDAAPRKHGYR